VKLGVVHPSHHTQQAAGVSQNATYIDNLSYLCSTLLRSEREGLSQVSTKGVAAMLVNWQQWVQRNLEKALRWHAGMAALLYPSGEELFAQARPTVVALIKEALSCFDVSADGDTAEILMYLYPSLAAEAWAAQEVVGNQRVAKERARSIVADALAMGYVGSVTWQDLEHFDPQWWREYQDAAYEALIRR